MDKRVCFYEEGQLYIIDLVYPDTGLTASNREDLPTVRKRYPFAEVVPFDYACERIDEAAKEKYPMLRPEGITEEQYMDALECLPPDQWIRSDQGSTFKCSERTFGDITQGYAYKNGKHFRMYCRIKTTHDEMLAVCQ